MDRFKGYYFKCADKEHSISFIPAKHGAKSSLQIITDKASYNTELHNVIFGAKPPQARFDSGTFSDKGIKLSLNTAEIKASGILRFGSLTPLRYDVMGPFKLMSPVLQCRHRVISMLHTVNGKIVINNESFAFNNGKGYIEGDEGVSFPKNYLWTQCFFKDGSLMLSIADVPICGLSIKGIIGVISVKGEEYRFGTYLGARLKILTDGLAQIKQGSYALTVKKLADNNGEPLYAPQNGNMSRIITEAVKCRVYFRLEYKNKTLLENTSSYGSFESCLSDQ